jgi:hypothetical protein
MVLEKYTEADVVCYRWTELDGTPITDWYADISDALQYAIESATR